MKDMEANEDSYDRPERRTELINLPWLVAFLLPVIFVAAFSGYAFQSCFPSRFYLGIDSWGNICGAGSEVRTYVAGVNGSGKVMSEQPYLWLVGINQMNAADGEIVYCDPVVGVPSASNISTISVCVKTCPTIGLNDSSLHEDCKAVLHESSYDRLTFSVAYEKCQQLVAASYATNQTCTSLSTINTTRMTEILGRCLPLDLLQNRYVSISSYISVWHYAVYDLLSNADVVGSCVVLVMAACVVISVLVIKYPQFACFLCYGTSIFLSLSSCIYHIVRAIRSTGDEFMISMFTSVLSVSATLILLYLFIRNYQAARMCKGMLIETSKCLRTLPKLLSQPLLTLVLFFIANLLLVLYIFYAYSCQSLIAANDFQTVIYSPSVPILASPGVVSVVILFYLWCINIFKTMQQAVVAGAVYQWYYARVKFKLLHPITKSLRALLLYNLGSVIGCSFNGSIQSKIVRYILSFKRQNKVEDVNINNEHRFRSLTSYLSPIAPASIGIYGFVRSTCLCGDKHLHFAYSQNVQIPSSQVLVKKKSSQILQTEALGLYKTIQIGHFAARWCFRSCHLAFVCSIVTIYVVLIEYKGFTVYVKLVPFATLLFVSHFICDVCMSIMTSTIDAIGVCFYEDLCRNDGQINLFYGSRGLVYWVTGVKLSETSTYGGLNRLKKKEAQEERQRKRREVQRLREQEAKARIRNRKQEQIRRPRLIESRSLAAKVKSAYRMNHLDTGLIGPGEKKLNFNVSEDYAFPEIDSSIWKDFQEDLPEIYQENERDSPMVAKMDQFQPDEEEISKSFSTELSEDLAKEEEKKSNVSISLSMQETSTQRKSFIDFGLPILKKSIAETNNESNQENERRDSEVMAQMSQFHPENEISQSFSTEILEDLTNEEEEEKFAKSTRVDAEGSPSPGKPFIDFGMPIFHKNTADNSQENETGSAAFQNTRDTFGWPKTVIKAAQTFFPKAIEKRTTFRQIRTVRHEDVSNENLDEKTKYEKSIWNESMGW
ncbi:uncharacterized protein LOC143446461 [Clavelina lepadiformis]|uniref:uncharacterized protein LOC143446461 n=1 Tax=Clavelina lepadiformis TaxID=159417 RepID=UPI004041E51D